MDQLPEQSILSLFVGEPEPVPKGWITLSDVAQLVRQRLPLAVRPCPFERFVTDVPADAEPFDLTCAALWAIIDLCPKQAFLTTKFRPYKSSNFLTPPPPGHRHERANKHVALMLGRLGTGTADESRRYYFERPMLLWHDEVIAALVALGLADADPPGIEIALATIPPAKNASPVAKGTGRPRSSKVSKALLDLGLADAFAFSARGSASPPQSDEPKSVGRPRKVEPAAELIAARYPEGTTRPSNKVLADEMGVSPATISRALKAIQNYQNPFDNFARLDDLRTLKASLLHPNLEDADEKPVDPPA
jgi:hypothetical protein